MFTLTPQNYAIFALNLEFLARTLEVRQTTTVNGCTSGSLALNIATRTRAHAIASACARFPWLGAGCAEQLLELVRLELGSESALEEGVQRPSGSRCLPLPPERTLHIVSGNTPHAALQSLTRGLLLGGRHFVKLPRRGLPEVAEFLHVLPPELASTVETSEMLPPEWLSAANCVVVFGSDETLDEIRRGLRLDQKFIGHGHKFGSGFVYGKWSEAVAASAARDVVAFDQLGCLSPIALFVEEEPERFAEALAEILAAEELASPRAAVAPEVSARITGARREWMFREKSEGSCRVWASPGTTAWTVVYEESEQILPSPLHRFIFVKPHPERLEGLFAEYRWHLSTAGVYQANASQKEVLIRCGFQRICPLGEMQKPGVFWHPDGIAPLASRVCWVDMDFR